ncbi:universal stress protein [Pseudaminobacter arsenicus]|uniref:Universal stress protein n=1 Tax=Borborobacter arsenicus TaxID=1851146 RepID=A0A432V9C1_9HYPH|nr:universal stress protein [Pseudaminobacter arsenicus]RUM98782.1 universal stress protein [Pseudaminobacter arsenicus]
MYTHILLTTDGSELAQRGVDHGLTLAKHLGSKVTALTVTPPYPLQVATTVDAWEAGQKEHADATLAPIRKVAFKMGVQAHVVHATNASPAEAIVDTAQRLGCDLIVMASHGRRGVSHLLLGSQTSEVAHYSAIPVLVVR